MLSVRPKVLMLGWEFPPIINGGLGVACHDLAAAMSDYADIAMIVPKATPGFTMSRLKLIGLNAVDVSNLRAGPPPGFRLPFKITEVIADLDPYYTLSDPVKGQNSASYFSGYGSYLHRRDKCEPFEIEHL